MSVACSVATVTLLLSTAQLLFVLHQNDQTFGQLVGGARTYYSFELFLEIRKEGEKFQKYGRGGEILNFEEDLAIEWGLIASV